MDDRVGTLVSHLLARVDQSTDYGRAYADALAYIQDAVEALEDDPEGFDLSEWVEEEE